MEHCGLSYILGKVIDANEPVNKFSNSSFKNNHNNGNKFGSPSTSTYSSNFNSYNNNQDLVLKLDPAFDQLLLYPECEELVHRRAPVSAEMRQILYTEQRKYSIQLKVRTEVFVYIFYIFLLRACWQVKHDRLV